MKPSLRLIDVSIPPTHQVGRIEWPLESIANPQTEFATVRIAPADSDAVEAWFQAQNAEGHVVIFVHGFNVPFDGAVYRLAQLIADAEPMAAPILFTWPSLGSAFAYVYDRESAAYSRDALEDLLRTAAANPRVTSITILAHSMGTWLAMETLRQYAMRSGRIDPKINNVILASPDLDADVFRMQFLSLGEERPNFTFLIARDDRALLISRLLAAGVTRVGSADITREPYRSALAQVEGVTVVDMTGLGQSDRTNHLLFAESPQAVRLLSAMFMMGQANDPNAQVGIPTSMGAMVIILAQGAVTMVDPPEAPTSAAPKPDEPLERPEPMEPP
jgi:esterase/lipase superfamily enzyme